MNIRHRAKSRKGKPLESLRIGVFGGSFDPIHTGHLLIAEQAKEQLKLDRVIFVPAFIPPHKLRGTSTTATHRLTMTRLAVKGNSSFSVSEIELKRKGISYTVDTLRELRKRIPRAELFLIIGSDNLVDYRDWKSPKEILTLCRLAVYVRPGFAIPKWKPLKDGSVILLKGAKLELSSTLIRKKIARGLSIRYLVPENVRRFVTAKKLYRI